MVCGLVASSPSALVGVTPAGVPSTVTVAPGGVEAMGRSRVGVLGGSTAAVGAAPVGAAVGAAPVGAAAGAADGAAVGLAPVGAADGAVAGLAPAAAALGAADGAADGFAPAGTAAGSAPVGAGPAPGWAA